jgi:protein TonB
MLAGIAGLAAGGEWPASTTARASGGLIALIAHVAIVCAWLLYPAAQRIAAQMPPVQVSVIDAPRPLPPEPVALPQAQPQRPPPAPMLAVPEVPEVHVPRVDPAPAITVQPIVPEPTPAPRVVEPIVPAASAAVAAAPPPAPAAPPTISISQVRYLRAPEPAYPLGSRRAHEEGRVEIRVLVDALGAPAQASVLRSSGHERLDEAALAAVRAARFKPYTENGIARPFWVVVPLVFEIDA